METCKEQCFGKRELLHKRGLKAQEGLGAIRTPECRQHGKGQAASFCFFRFFGLTLLLSDDEVDWERHKRCSNP
eukprot:5001644-Amphidinium_carterae.1